MTSRNGQEARSGSVWFVTVKTPMEQNEDDVGDELTEFTVEPGH